MTPVRTNTKLEQVGGCLLLGSSRRNDHLIPLHQGYLLLITIQVSLFWFIFFVWSAHPLWPNQPSPWIPNKEKIEAEANPDGTSPYTMITIIVMGIRSYISRHKNQLSRSLQSTLVSCQCGFCNYTTSVSISQCQHFVSSTSKWKY